MLVVVTFMTSKRAYQVFFYLIQTAERVETGTKENSETDSTCYLGGRHWK